MEKVIAGTVVLVGWLIAATLLSAFVIATLWGWFLTPIYGVAVPPTGNIIGLSLLFGWFIPHSNKDAKTDESFSTTVVTGVVTFLARAGIVLLMGFVVAKAIGVA